VVFCGVFIAAVVLETSVNGVGLKIDSDLTQVDPAKNVFLQVELKVPADKSATMPDLRDRVVGFSVAAEMGETSKTEADGSETRVVEWGFVPKPCAASYKIRPFVVKVSPKLLSSRSDEGMYSFVAGPVKFEPPAAREPVTGGMECDPKKDLPPLSWKLVGWIAAAVLAVLGLVAILVMLVKYLARRIREHRMSPIERAWVELDRLLKKGLPGRGRYKDFYVELTMVVRRYIQRKYGISAPHMTTEEFLRAAKPTDELRRFLESADMVKFAGVEATPDMADDATESARGYLKSDDATVPAAGKGAVQ